jgi:hypothetical protein
MPGLLVSAQEQFSQYADTLPPFRRAALRQE